MHERSLKTLLARLAAGNSLDESWEPAGFASRREAGEAIDRLARSIVEPRPVAERAGVNRAILHADGASRGNPGPSAIAAILFLPTGEELASVAKRIGRATNNVAEYRAVIEGMKLARHLGVRELDVRLDSELVVKQITGAYRIRSKDLEPLAREVASAAKRFARCSFGHVPRGRNREADRLANEALDRVDGAS